MSEPARNRFALDLEDLERQLRSAGQAPRSGQSTDPLAELTRIVDQGDPLKDIFGQRGAAPAPTRATPSWPAATPAPAQPRIVPEAPREEPQFDAIRQFQAVAEQAPPPAELRGALDEFEALLRRTDSARPAAPVAPAPAPLRAAPRFDSADESFERPEPQAYQRPVTAPAARDLDEANEAYGYRDQPDAYDPQPVHAAAVADEDMPDLEPRRSRRGLYAAAALIVVGVVGVGAAMSLRGPTRSADGQPPTIAAATGPTKVEPVNPGGAEIPNQNKQIYERPGDGQSGATKVVSREEQPVDVQQAARSMPTRVVMPGPGSATATPPANALSQAPATAAPVCRPDGSTRPDGTPAPPANGSANSPSGYTNGAVPLATGSAPPARPAGLSPSATSAPAPVAAAPATPQSRPATTPAAEAPKVQERAAAPATTPAAPLRVANAAPAATAPAAPATAALRAGTGDFVVQLGAPGSEAEARATFAALQRKYPGQLGGQAPIVRKTELAGGKTVYRLRVGPYSREDATSMCTALQAAGGQCFIAKN